MEAADFFLCNVLPQRTQMPRCEGSDVLGRTWGERTITWAACRRGKGGALPCMFLHEIPPVEITLFLTFKNQKNTPFVFN